MPYELQKLTYYKEAINSLEGLKDDFDYIGVSDSVSSILQELIDNCLSDLADLEDVANPASDSSCSS